MAISRTGNSHTFTGCAPRPSFLIEPLTVTNAVDGAVTGSIGSNSAAGFLEVDAGVGSSPTMGVTGGKLDLTPVGNPLANESQAYIWQYTANQVTKAVATFTLASEADLDAMKGYTFNITGSAWTGWRLMTLQPNSGSSEEVVVAIGLNGANDHQMLAMVVDDTGSSYGEFWADVVTDGVDVLATLDHAADGGQDVTVTVERASATTITVTLSGAVTGSTTLTVSSHTTFAAFINSMLVNDASNWIEPWQWSNWTGYA